MWWRKKSLTIALTCADWRLHRDKAKLLKRLNRKIGVEVADLIALPGPDGLCAPGRTGDWNATLTWTKLLALAHDAQSVAVVAHQDCAGHNVSNEQHEKDVVAVASALKRDLGFDGLVWAIVAVHRSDTDWPLKVIEKI